MNIGVVGCGYWGNHIIRNFNNSPQWNLKYICDSDKESLGKMASKYPDVKAVTEIEQILSDSEIDAVAIATPVNTHYGLAKKALLAGKHAWVEKPLCSSSAEAEELVHIAAEKNVLLNVDHTYVYTPSVRKIKELVEKGELGKILYFDSVRINLGLFQHDVNVIWDLAPHDISILQFCVGAKPVRVRATGKAFFKYTEKDIHSIAYVSVEFVDGSMANFHVNWMSPVKIRHIILGGSEKMLVFNDMETLSKIKVYDSGVSVNTPEDIYETLIQYRVGDMYSPAIRNFEALASECGHFYDCIKEGRHTDTDGEAGLYVVRLLEAADKSLEMGGIPVEV